MSIADSQARIFLRLVGQLRPHWRRDPALPARIQTLLSAHREFGARDRRLYRELIYTSLRFLPWIEPCLDTDADEAVRRTAWLAAEVPATKLFRETFATGEAPHGDKTLLLPAWFRDHCPEIFSAPELDAQLRRAPLWLRFQTAEPNRVFGEFEALGWRWRQSAVLPGAIELLTEADVTKTESWREGRIEVQDLGSQLLLEAVGIAPGGAWLDACAGAGGKTLQLANLLGPGASIDAHDIRPEALRELETRAARAGLQARIRVVRDGPTRAYDSVLVDAPCSGSGTWRRAPHLKWTTTASDIARATDQQRKLLDVFSTRVRPGGRLIYATCSLSSRENEETVMAFLATHADFHPVPLTREFGAKSRGVGFLLLPSTHDTDGFFVSALRRE